MKWSNLAVSGLATAALFGAASAQSDFTPPPDVSTSTYSNPSSTAANTSLTAPRTGIYAAVTALNAAADNTVDDYTRRPTLINGQQYFAAWGGTTLVNGAWSFNGKGYDWFGSAQGTNAPSQIRAGLAQGGAWGAGLMLALAKSTADGTAGDSKTVLEGDGFGLFGNVDLGNSDVYAALNIFTGFDDLTAGDDDYRKVGDTENENTLFGFLAGWKKDATGEGTHALNAEVVLDYSSKDEEAPVAEGTVTDFELGFYHGYILKENPSYDVFLGSSTLLGVRMEEDEGAGAADASFYGLEISPNIAFQKTLLWGFEGFAGASFSIGWQMADDATLTLPGETPAPGTNEGQLFYTTNAGADLGLRWVKDNLAIEGSLSPTFLSSGPNFIGGGTPGFLTQVGVSLGI